MKYKFAYYTDEYFDQMETLIFNSYAMGFPAYLFNQLQFDRGVHSAWANNKANWEQTTGLWFINRKLAAAVISVGAWMGDAFFIFDSPEYADDKELLPLMFHHAETHMACFRGMVPYADRTRYFELIMPPYFGSAREMAKERGYVKSGHVNKINILPFDGAFFPSEYKGEYTIADGNTVPPFYSANAHMFSFNYTLPTANSIKSGFEDLKKMKGYDPDFDLVALDLEGKPLGLAIVWYNEALQYCELEPLGVVWWSRRQGIGRSLIYELANRVIKKYPSCKGMIGGDQQFYQDLGFETKACNEIWKWEQRF